MFMGWLYNYNFTSYRNDIKKCSAYYYLFLICLIAYIVNLLQPITDDGSTTLSLKSQKAGPVWPDNPAI